MSRNRPTQRSNGGHGDPAADATPTTDPADLLTDPALAPLLAALTAEPADRKLEGLTPALAAFRAHVASPSPRTRWRRSMLTSLAGAKLGVAIAATAATVGGAATVAYVTTAASDAPETAATASPTQIPSADPTQKDKAGKDAEPGTPVGPDATGSPAYGLCTAWKGVAASGKAMDSVALQNLVEAAGTEDDIEAFCAEVPAPGEAAAHATNTPTDLPTGKPETVPTTNAATPTSRPTTTPTGKPATVPTAPSTHPSGRSCPPDQPLPPPPTRVPPGPPPHPAAHGCPGLGPDDDDHAHQRERPADHGAERERLTREPHSERHGDDGVDVGVRRDDAHGRGVEQVRVRGVREDRSREHEVRPRRRGTGADRGERRALARKPPDQHEGAAGDEHLVRRRDEDVTGERQPTADHRPERPGRRGDRGEDGGVRRDPRRVRTEERRQPDEPPDRAHRAREGRSAARRGPEGDDPQGDGRDDERGHRGGEVLLGVRHETVPGRGEQEAHDRAAVELPTGHAQPSPRAADDEERGEEGAGGEEPRPGPEEGRDLLDHEPDREVRAAPHDADDGEREPGAGGHGGPSTGTRPRPGRLGHPVARKVLPRHHSPVLSGSGRGRAGCGRPECLPPPGGRATMVG